MLFGSEVGMKIVTGKEMARIENLSISSSLIPIDEQYMETAGKAIASYIDTYLKQIEHKTKLASKKTPIILLCAKGNNSGDAYVAGVYLLLRGYQVIAIQITDIDKATILCQRNQKRFTMFGGEISASANKKHYPRLVLL